MNEISLYVHIPFCEQKCNYCAFVSFCAKNDTIDDYVDTLCKEITSRKTESPVKTIYIGGGTPSMLSIEQLKKIVDCIFANFNVYEDAEFTIEANPNSLTEEKLKLYKSMRINRLSIGVQSLSDKSLKKIGRLHTKKEALEKIALARKYFDNISCDLIVGLEGETAKDLCRYAKSLLELKIKHISCYLLEVYEHTKLADLVAKNKYTPLSDEQTVEAFNKLANYLQDSGLVRYEISNFAYEGYESKHNLNYWARGEYLGFGVSAHSFVGNERTQNASDISSYKNGQKTMEVLSQKEQVEEVVMLGLRCNLGIDKVKLTQMGYDIEKNPYFEDYLKQGIIEEKNGKIFLKPIYYHISNTIISNLLP
ncbi:MAG: radical SAM family heme chaperone HemW [Candidatus Caccovivens sp.]